MAVSLKFYSDAALTQEVNAASPIYALQDTANSLTPVQKQLWLGSTATGTVFKATSNPGVADIVISVTDSNGVTGQTTAAVKLATTQAGLAAAVAGASLTVGPTRNSGVSNAFTFWTQLDDVAAAVGSYTDLGLTTNALNEDPV